VEQATIKEEEEQLTFHRMEPSIEDAVNHLFGIKMARLINKDNQRTWFPLTSQRIDVDNGKTLQRVPKTQWRYDL
jgi:hypothetical protein